MWILLLLPFIGLLWVPFYNHELPSLFGFPFFIGISWSGCRSLRCWSGLCIAMACVREMNNGNPDQLDRTGRLHLLLRARDSDGLCRVTLAKRRRAQGCALG